MTRLSRTLAALLPAAAWALSAGAVFAQSTPPVQLGPNAWVLMGTSGNVVIVPGPQGVLLVDDERPTDMQEMQDAVKAVSDQPVRYVVNTHWHLDHSGGNAGFGAAGATIVAHREVRTRLSTDQFMAAYNSHIPASPEIALPTVVYDSAMDIHVGGETVHLHYTPAAHTDGDSLVKLQASNVLHMGDVFFNGLFPFIDRSSGGSIQGLIAAVDAGLELSDADTRIVPAHGDLATRADLQAYRDMLQDLSDKVQAGITAGQTLEQIQAGRPTAAYPLEGDAARLVAAIYDSLTAARPAAEGRPASHHG